jgi:hypothetical protein
MRGPLNEKVWENKGKVSAESDRIQPSESTTRSKSQVSVGSQADKLKNAWWWFSINQNEVRLDVAIAMVRPLASESMIKTTLWKRLIFQ